MPDGNGGLRAAAVWRLHKTYKTYKTYKIMIGAPRYTPRVCRALFGMAQGGRFTVGVKPAKKFGGEAL